MILGFTHISIIFDGDTYWVTGDIDGYIVCCDGFDDLNSAVQHFEKLLKANTV